MTDSCSNTNEDMALDRALEDATPLLAESLQREEHMRRRRRKLLFGGLIMLAILATIVTVVAINSGQPATTTDKPGTPNARIDAVAKSDDIAKQGWLLWQSGQYDKAANNFAEAIKLDPSSPNLWNGLGWSLFHLGERDKAADAFKQVLQLDETHGAALNGLGQIAYVKRDYDAAKDWFLKAKDAPVAQQTLISVYLLQSEYKKAEALADEQLKTLPADSQDTTIVKQRNWLLKLQAAAKSGELSDDLRKLIEPTEPKQGDATEAQKLSQRGWQLWGEQRWRAAELAFTEALEIDPDLAEAQNGMGWALISQGKFTEAEQHLRRCIELTPDHGGAMNGLAMCLKNQGKIDEAIKLWEQMYEKSPQPHAGAANLARTYVEQGRYVEAIPLLEQLTEANPGANEYQQLLDQAKSGGTATTPDDAANIATNAGDNILTNGGFENGTDGWIIGGNSGHMKLSTDTNEKAEGKQSLKVTKKGGMPIDIVRINADGLTAGQTVDVSAMIKTDNVGNGWMKFYVWDADGNVLIDNLDVTRIHGTKNWHKVGRRFKLPANTNSASIQFWMILDGTLWIDDVRVSPVN